MINANALIACTGALFLTASVFAADSSESSKAAHASLTASKATADAVRSHISGLFYGTTAFYRISRSAEYGPAASWDEGEVSYSLTPTLVSVNNKVDPLHSLGTVGVVVAGVEHFDEIDTITGVTLSVDTLSVTSTEIASAGNPAVETAVSGLGFTIAPYFARQLESGWLLDASVGIGASNMKTNTDAVNGKPKSSRLFVSAGFTRNQGLGDDSTLLSTKFAFSYSNDSLKAFSLSDNTSIAASKTTLMQLKGSMGLSWPTDRGTPYVNAGIFLNSFTATGGGSTKPVEHSVTYIAKAGYRVISGDYYGDLSLQMERDKNRFQLYFGRRF